MAAQDLSKVNGASIDGVSILQAILIHNDSLASNILNNYDLSAEKIELFSAMSKSPDKNRLNNDGKNILDKAVNLAAQFGHTSVDPEHLLLAIVSDSRDSAYQMIKQMKADPESIKTRLLGLFQEFAQISEMEKVFQSQVIKNEPKKNSSLDYFSTDLTALAKQGKLDPVIGRKNEIERIIQILSRRSKNNPILIGEPGVGKTAIVEGIAQRLANNDVPGSIIGRRLVNLDLASLVAGTIYRGQFEERIKKIIDEITKLNNVILFIDEIHTLIGAGSAEGTLDASQILKPSLSKNGISLIGATTSEEYRKYIEKDMALTRRFQSVVINEPTIDESLKIISGLKKEYEKFHHVWISEDALEAAVKLSDRYLNDRFLPDKAIDLLDEAAAAVNAGNRLQKQLITLKNRQTEINEAKNRAVLNEQYAEADKLKNRQMIIEQQVARLKQKIQDQPIKTIGKSEIEKTVAKITKIPVGTIDENNINNLKQLDKNLSERVIGQYEAIASVSDAIRRSRTGVSSPNRPLASFIFLGPSGVGKSELAKQVAEIAYGDEKALVKIDMSEFMEKHNVSRLVGAPAGYVGYEEGGKLTETIRRQPHSIILLDEVEKAHPDVFNLLLQILEDGYLTDAKGKKVDFRHTMLIMTSNIGIKDFNKAARFGFQTSNSTSEKNYQDLKNGVLSEIKDFFRPEFLNRIDKVVVFHPLSFENLQQIVDLQLQELGLRLKDSGINLQVDSAAKRLLVELAYDPDNGARPLRRTIQNHIETPLAQAILEGKIDKKKTAFFSRDNDQLVLR